MNEEELPEIEESSTTSSTLDIETEHSANEDRERLQRFINTLAPDRLKRYESFRRAGFNKNGIRKLINNVMGQACNMKFIISVAGVAKVFVGELVEKAKEIQEEWEETGSLKPSHVSEAYRRLYNKMPHLAVKHPHRMTFIPVITSIRVTNFMCHHHLEVNFTKKLTLISGLNGSGKSAVMAAIGLILSHSARTLDRGGNLKGFIMNGKTQSTLTLTMNNTANFNRQFFGSTIIIEKKITQNGSSFSIMNGNKKRWSSKTGDLEKVMDAFSLRLKNPLNFLTQEHAKKFLTTAQPSTLYEFFMKGTEIEDTKKLHEECELRVGEMIGQIDKLLNGVEKINKQIKNYESRMNILRNAKECEKHIVKLRLEVEWSKVSYKELLVKKEEVLTIRAKIDNFTTQINKAVQEIAVAKNKQAENEVKMQEERVHDNEKSNAYKQELNTIELRMKDLSGDLQEMDEDINALKKKLSEHEKLEKVGDMESMRNQLTNLNGQQENDTQQKNNKQNRYNELKPLVENERIRIEKLNTQINTTKKLIEDSKRVKQNKLSFFGESFPNFIREIKSTRFNGRVIGPLLDTIKLKDGKFFKPVSVVLRSLLCSFICYNTEDRSKLQSFIKKHRVNVNIYLPKGSTGEKIQYPKTDHLSMADVIEVSDNSVFNQLIIIAHIERIILLENRSEAHRIMRSKPRNVECAYTLTCDQIMLHGNSISDFSKQDSRDNYFFENTEDRIEEMENKMRILLKENRENIYKNEFEILKNDIFNMENVIEKKARNINNLKKELCQLEEIKNTLYADDTKRLVNELQTYEKQRKGIKNKYVENENRKTTLEKKLQILKEKKYTESHLLGNEIRKQEMNLYSTRTMKQNSETKLMRAIREQQVIEEKIEQERQLLLKKGPEIKTKRSEDTINHEIYEMQAQIDLSKKTGTEEEIQAQITEKIDLKEEKESLIQMHNNKINDLRESTVKRIAKREEIKINESKRAATDFKKFMALRNYDGSLIFNHDDMLLDIHVKLSGNKTGGSKNTLSGGERSYASVCLLLSLWPSVLCPVKILDEFDVFMDNLNRKCALQAIVKYFNEQSVQVILITPLDTNDFFSENCEVKVLSPPRDKGIE